MPSAGKLTTDFGINDVEILDNEKRYNGFLQINRIVLRHRLYQGGWSGNIQREVVNRTPGVGVLLYDPEHDSVLLVEQFRVGCLDDPKGPWTLELVAGLIDTQESAAAVAIREAEEEAGVVLHEVFHVCDYYNSPGSSTEKLSIFCAGISIGDIREGVFGLDTENEDIRTILVSREEAMAAIGEGLINNAMSIIALQWLTLHRHEVRESFANAP